MIQVTRATADDAEAASSALSALYHRKPAGVEPMRRMLSDPTFFLLLARSSDEVVGYLHAELLNRLDGRLMLLVYDMTVAPDRRREGIGTLLIETALRLGRDLGAMRCWIVTEADNAAACGLYESLGGTEWSAVGFGWTLDQNAPR